MHELSVALAILDGVAEEVERRQLPPVVAVHLRLGPLAGVVADYLHSAWELAREGSISREARLVIEEVPITIRCRPCDAVQEVVSMQDMVCPSCGTPSASILTGRELLVTGLEVEGEVDQ